MKTEEMQKIAFAAAVKNYRIVNEMEKKLEGIGIADAGWFFNDMIEAQEAAVLSIFGFGSDSGWEDFVGWTLHDAVCKDMSVDAAFEKLREAEMERLGDE